MKKTVVCSMVLLACSLVAAGLFATAADDYQVIKNAVKSTAPSRAARPNAQWFKIVVTGKEGERESVKISLPLSLVEIMLSACPEKKFNVEHGCEIDLRRVWNDLKAAGPMSLVEIEEHGETVKIWLE